MGRQGVQKGSRPSLPLPMSWVLTPSWICPVFAGESQEFQSMQTNPLMHTFPTIL